MTAAQKKIVERITVLKAGITHESIKNMDSTQLDETLDTLNKMYRFACFDRSEFITPEFRTGMQKWCVDRMIECCDTKRKHINASLKKLRDLKTKLHAE